MRRPGRFDIVLVILIFVLNLLFSPVVFGFEGGMICAKDLNGDGEIQESEYASCNEHYTCPDPNGSECDENHQCVVTSEPGCPLGNFSCRNGICTKVGVCQSKQVSYTEYVCPVNNKIYDQQDVCNDNCIEVGVCDEHYTCPDPAGSACNKNHQCVITSNPVCPLGEYSCKNGMCKKIGICQSEQISYTEYVCPVDNKIYNQQDVCNDNCIEVGTCNEHYTCPDPNGSECDENHQCVVTSEPGCPLGNYPCKNGVCKEIGTCRSKQISYTKYVCPVDNRIYDQQDTCNNNCIEVGACEKQCTNCGGSLISEFTMGYCIDNKDGWKLEFSSDGRYIRYCYRHCRGSWECGSWIDLFGGSARSIAGNQGIEYDGNGRLRAVAGRETGSWVSLYGSGKSNPALGQCPNLPVFGFEINNGKIKTWVMISCMWWDRPIPLFGDGSWINIPQFGYRCSLNGSIYSSLSSCQSSCRRGKTCVTHTDYVTKWECSLDGRVYDTEDQCTSSCYKSANCNCPDGYSYGSGSEGDVCKQILSCNPYWSCSIFEGTFFSSLSECQSSCRKGKTCVTHTDYVTKWKCSLDNKLYDTEDQCTSSCYKSASCICPSGYSYNSESSGDICKKVLSCNPYWTCSLFNSTYSSLSSCKSSCRKGRTCVTHTNSVTKWECSLDEELYETKDQCTSSCYESARCNCPSGYSYSDGDICKKVLSCNGYWVCPLPGGSECISIDVSDTLENDMKFEEEETEFKYYDDNGWAEDGSCTGQIIFFNGYPNECLTAGIKTGFHNCCNDCKSKIKNDLNNAIEKYGMLLKAPGAVWKAIKTAYVAAAAYKAYKAGKLGYRTTQVAFTHFKTLKTAVGKVYSTSKQMYTLVSQAKTMSEAIQKALLQTFNPTSILIGFAASFVMDQAMKIIFGGCNATSILTACYKEMGLCHYVGEYCKKKWPAVGCVQKAKVYCCYNSKLARIINEAARQQLKTLQGWGSAKFPVCRGLYPEEFQMLDFSKIDLSEWYEDIKTRAMENIQQKMEENVEKFKQGYQQPGTE